MNKHTINMNDMWNHIKRSGKASMIKFNKEYWITDEVVLIKCLPENLKYKIDEADTQKQERLINILSVNREELFESELSPVLLADNSHDGYLRVLMSDNELTYIDEKYIAPLNQSEVSFYTKKIDSCTWKKVYVYYHMELIGVIMPMLSTEYKLDSMRKFVEVFSAELPPLEKQPGEKKYVENECFTVYVDKDFANNFYRGQKLLIQVLDSGEWLVDCVAIMPPENVKPYVTPMVMKQEQMRSQFNKFRCRMLKRKGVPYIDMSINDDDLPF